MTSDDGLPGEAADRRVTWYRPGQSGNPDTRFKPGHSGNPSGSRAKSRYKLSEAFIRQLHLDFEEHGAETIVSLREQRPQDYLKIIASLIPRQEREPEVVTEFASVVFVRPHELDEMMDNAGQSSLACEADGGRRR